MPVPRERRPFKRYPMLFRLQEVRDDVGSSGSRSGASPWIRVSLAPSSVFWEEFWYFAGLGVFLPPLFLGLSLDNWLLGIQSMLMATVPTMVWLVVERDIVRREVLRDFWPTVVSSHKRHIYSLLRIPDHLSPILWKANSRHEELVRRAMLEVFRPRRANFKEPPLLVGKVIFYFGAPAFVSLSGIYVQSVICATQLSEKVSGLIFSVMMLIWMVTVLLHYWLFQMRRIMDHFGFKTVEKSSWLLVARKPLGEIPDIPVGEPKVLWAVFGSLGFIYTASLALYQVLF